MIRSTWRTILSYVFICFNSLNVSSNHVLIIRRINCINITSGICHSVSVTVSCAGPFGPMCFGPQGTFIKELNRSNISWNKMHGMKYTKNTIVFFNLLLEAIKIWDRIFGLSAENWTRDLLVTNQQPIMNRYAFGGLHIYKVVQIWPGLIWV